MSTEELRLEQILKDKNKSHCPECNRKIDRGDFAWNSGSTEYGTGYSVVEIICQQCDIEIAIIHSWYAPIEDLEDLCYVLEKDKWK